VWRQINGLSGKITAEAKRAEPTACFVLGFFPTQGSSKGASSVMDAIYQRGRSRGKSIPVT